MFAVIFTAKPGTQDQHYSAMAKQMRERAFTHYGCLEFVDASADGREVAISYWPDMQSILAWKKDTAHTKAQTLGREKWYTGYKVEVVEIKRSYSFGAV
ncbi:MAG: antibiotic biosynthesis monooxygenase [Gammaproteobacteria bacterium]|nr:antibiotic biosynthesis monooxygenase [Gammaproteobacteria bacterium]